jgi:hypothetical protein
MKIACMKNIILKETPVFDEVITTGKPVRINRRGKTIIIRREETVGKLDKLASPQSKVYVGDSDEVVSMNWESEWKDRPI